MFPVYLYSVFDVTVYATFTLNPSNTREELPPTVVEPVSATEIPVIARENYHWKVSLGRLASSF